MPDLPPACPALGCGSSLCPTYSHTYIVMDCWRCEVVLPEVMQKLYELRQADSGRSIRRFPALQGFLDPANVPYGYSDAYREVLDAAFVSSVGLCPRCLELLGRAGPRGL